MAPREIPRRAGERSAGLESMVTFPAWRSHWREPNWRVEVEPTRTMLFVYGTLKRGGRNFHRLADQEFIGVAVTAPRYRVIDLGAHPGLVRDELTGLAIHGELFAVNDRCLAELDEFEEVPGPFVRALIEVD